ncbi:hypothetical protein ATY81_08055 [Rhizobium sp. R72]|nr:MULTISPECIES: TetR/AcrR family transcriptional regulator [unclassified Rhizobium]OWV97380.1 hypothetical protein ATY81_08055 [Rhizobium sp. R72]OWV97719.1 hypothetical protein ATY80_08055 [Rhizobium sp. R711]
MADNSTRAEVRERILDVAEKHVRHVGHQKTNVADIANELGMSRASVYRFFPTRAAIDHSLYARFAEQALEAIRDIARSTAPARVKLVAILETLHHRTRRQLAEERNIHALFVAAAGENWRVTRSYLEHLRADLEAVICDGQKASEIPATDPSKTAQSIITAMTPFLHPVLVEQRVFDGGDIDADLDLHVRFIMRALEVLEE